MRLRLVRFSALRLPCFRGGDFLAWLFDFAFLGVGKARMRRRIATMKRLVIAGHSRSKNGVASLAYDPAIHGASPNTH
jgi:hypothetical protein